MNNFKPSDKNSYDVGYGKPPVNTRFKKGNSGNPAGRPKGKANFATDLARALATKVTVNEGGRRVQKTKQAVAITQQVNKAVSGDTKAFQMVHIMLPILDPTVAPGVTPDLAVDREMAQRVAQRFAARSLKSNTGGSDDETK